MSRLPVPGDDDGVWGEVLNDYLLQTHDSAGKLKPDSVATSNLQNGSVDSTKLSSPVVNSLVRANAAVLTVNGALPDASGNLTITGLQGPKGDQGIQGLPGTDGTNGTNGQDGTSITVTLVPAANWPAPSDPDPMHWYVKVP